MRELAACGVLRDLHNALDRLVAEAYGWPWPMPLEEILDRRVVLHHVRVEEEARGLVRWLRPEYQVPRFGAETEPPPESTEEIADAAREVVGGAAVEAGPAPWPASVLEQPAALQSLLAGAALSAEEAAARFEGAPIGLVRQQLELLTGAGEVWRDAEGRYRRAEREA